MQDRAAQQPAQPACRHGGWPPAGWSCAVASAIALLALMPLKRVEPFVIRVDNTTGIVDVVPVYTGGADHAGNGGKVFLGSLRHRL